MASPSSSPHPIRPEGELREQVSPRKNPLRPWTSIIVLAWAVRLISLFNIVNALLHYQPRFINWMGEWMPFEISEGYRIRMVVISMMLLVLASGLERGKRVAWQITIACLLIAPILHWGRAVIWPQAVINLVLIGFLVWNRRYFVAKSDQRSVRTAFIFCPLIAVALIIFGAFRIQSLHKHTRGDHSWAGCLQTSAELVLTHKSHTQKALTSQSKDLFRFLRLGGSVIALVGLVLLLRPVLLRRQAPLEVREKVALLLEEYGDDPLHPYALMKDKSYIFFAEGRAVIPYVLSSNIAVALTDPLCPPELHSFAIEQFVRYCRQQDWEPVFYAVRKEYKELYEQAGLSTFKIGESAGLQADEFHMVGHDFQNLRTIRNRANRLGIRFRWYSAADGIDENLERQIHAISDAWLTMKKTREMSFDMGAYSLEDIRLNGAALAVQSDGQVIAFATWRPFDHDRGRSLDLMRVLPAARSIMDFVLIESILSFREHGINNISLGLAPLANTENSPSQLVAEEKATQFLYENLNHVYGYKSLFEFKRKYRPQWRARYVAYRRGVQLPRVGLALARVHAPEGVWKFLVG